MGLITLFVSGLLAGYALAHSDVGALYFARLGTRFAEQDADGTTGYDGQFAYYIARDGAAALPFIDGPSFRYQRILYPLLSHVLALGRPALIPWTLLLVNLAAHAAGAALLTYLLVMEGAAPVTGLIYGVWIGMLTAILLDLNEPLTFALALGALVAYRHQRYRWAVAFLMLSALAKELGLIFAAGLALHAYFSGERRRAVLFVAGPLLVFLTWWGVLRLWLGTLPTRYPAARFHLIPFRGLLAETAPLERVMLVGWLVVPALIITLAALRYIHIKRDMPAGAAMVLASVGFMALLPDVVWDDPLAAYRVNTPFIIASLLFVGQCHAKRWRLLAAWWMPGILIILLGRGIFLL